MGGETALHPSRHPKRGPSAELMPIFQPGIPSQPLFPGLKPLSRGQASPQSFISLGENVYEMRQT